MAVGELDARVAALEAEVTKLKRKVQAPAETTGHWVDRVYGAFANDPDFDEAIRLGRKYRQSLHDGLRTAAFHRSLAERLSAHGMESAFVEPIPLSGGRFGNMAVLDGPGFLFCFGENNNRYLRCTVAR